MKNNDLDSRNQNIEQIDSNSNLPVDKTTATNSFNAHEASETSSAIKPKKSNKTLLIVLAIVLILVLPTIGFLAVMLLAAANYGKGNSLSALNNTFNIKSIPGIASVAPSDTDVVQNTMREGARSAVSMVEGVKLKELENLIYESYSGRIVFTNSISIAGKTNGQNVEINLDMELGSEASADGKKVRSFGEISGEGKLGIFNISAVKKPISFEILSERGAENFYIKLDMSEDIASYLQLGYDQIGLDYEEITGYKLEEILGSYIKLNLKDLEEAGLFSSEDDNVDYLFPEIQKYSDEEIKDIEKFINEFFVGEILEPLVKVYEEEYIDKIDTMGEIKRTKRTEITGIKVDVYEQELDTKKFIDLNFQAGEKLLLKGDELIRDEKNLTELCDIAKKIDKEGTSEIRDCKKEVSESLKEYNESTGDFINSSDYKEQRDELYKELVDIAEYVKSDGLVYYIDPVENKVRYSELSLSLTSKGNKYFSEELDFDVSKFSTKFGYEYIDSFELKYKEPSDAKDITKNIIKFYESSGVNNYLDGFEDGMGYSQSNNGFEEFEDFQEFDFTSLRVVGAPCSGYPLDGRDELAYVGSYQESVEDPNSLVCIAKNAAGESFPLEEF